MHQLTVKTIIHAPIEKVWDYWTKPEHIKKWNFASADWYCPAATNHLIVGGEFHYIMAAKDHSIQFDFWGTYHQITIQKSIAIELGDGRNMSVVFEETDHSTVVTESFDPEQENPLDLQQAGWQMILDNFKQYTERS